MRKREVALVQRSSFYINIERKCKAIRRTNYADKDIAATITKAHLFFS
jgi:hypothetical protein